MVVCSRQSYVQKIEGLTWQEGGLWGVNTGAENVPLMWHAGVLTSHPQGGLVFEVPGGALIAGVLAAL